MNITTNFGRNDDRSGFFLKGGDMVGNFDQLVLMIEQWQDNMPKNVVEEVLPSNISVTFPATITANPKYIT